MHIDRDNWTFDCEPTMTDSEVLAFCRDGCLLLRGVVPDEINRRACDWLDGTIPAAPSFVPDGMTQAEMDRIRGSHEPTTIFLEDWFIEHVLLNDQVAGIMRSLLGPAVGLPILASMHRVECPGEAGGWHQDADCVFGPELHFVEVFYFPQDTPAELGPTEILPRSHLARFDGAGEARRRCAQRRPGRHHRHTPSEHSAPQGSVGRRRQPPHAEVQLLAHVAARDGTGVPIPSLTREPPTTAATSWRATSLTCWRGLPEKATSFA